MSKDHSYPALEARGENVLIIYNELHRAVDLAQFRFRDGRRRNQMPFWIEYDGSFFFEQITDHTDVRELIKDIAAGIIWIRNIDAHKALEYQAGKSSEWPPIPKECAEAVSPAGGGAQRAGVENPNQKRQQ